MPVQIPEEEAATAAAPVELPVADPIRLAAVWHTLPVQPTHDAIKLLVAHEQRKGAAFVIVALRVGVVDIQLIVELHRREPGKMAAVLAAQDVIQEQGRAEFILAQDDSVIEYDGHRIPPIVIR